MQNPSYQICTKTVMDNISDPDITFDENGVCNYYYEFTEKLKIRIPSPEVGKRQLDLLVDKMKASGKGKNYDCIIGVSGGVDSTYTAWLVKSLGLRPLAVHLDNGWNSELAVNNIENILNKLGIDLHTEVLDWNMFKDLQLSFLKASTPDGEIPTDHAILALMYQSAKRFGVKYIISGMNFRNEGMLPKSWARGYLDWKYIKNVQKIFGTQSLENFPHFSFTKFLYSNIFLGVKNVSILNYIDFRKGEAIKIIEKELDWRNYGGKHYESIYTRFFQSYILPIKFGIDKRKAHLSCLIMSTGEVTREEALKLLEEPIADPKLVAEDKEYVIKKFGISESEFDDIMKLPVKSILDYPNIYFLESKFRKVLLAFRKLNIMHN
ncbi:N-acetyl sugar amidotransferase [Algoriphagus sp.]|uniref:N-acetyl sugar amidotransferase n=1 Tax=Algoriphagus sp. TaxID=1872435 RepID=UPI00271F620D|nr:N-acetyl sugar amidotransferase [Algoriphagus sp.]MDO8967468.1 N-acetyl sugar amidotransferase [Algoriphagus sp.]MDP3201778.1 N-acetyl sugar amidotransferase [Algoriphagus sp.]